MSLEFIPPQTPMEPPVAPPAIDAHLNLDGLGLGGHYETADGDLDAGCLRCSDTPCSILSLEERGGDDTVPPEVCATRAIVPADDGMTVTDACFGCGLCVTRCSFGAIRFEAGRARVQLAGDAYRPIAEDDAAARRKSIVRHRSWANKNAEAFLQDVLEQLAVLGQDPFYEFIAALLTCLGVPARASRVGDTSLRIDAVCPHPINSVPLEIKSPTETKSADLKAVRQALENYVIMHSRDTDSATPEASSLAIGFETLAERTDAHELAEDIEATYAVKVRIYSTVWLLGQLASVIEDECEFDSEAFRLGMLIE